MARRALLLAIADYDPLPSLDYVANDIPRLKLALARAGFNPSDLESGGAGSGEIRSRELTTTRLKQAISDFLDGARVDDEMLVFFSGHGLELDGQRVLLPQDYTPRHPGRPEDLVSDSWISHQARLSNAKSVLVLIDSCREGARFEIAPSKSGLSDTSRADAPLQGLYVDDATDGPTIAFLYGCAAGEQSGADRRGEGCSAFTRAFAEVIEMERGPAAFGAVAEEVRCHLVDFGGGVQTLTVSGRAGRGGDWQSLVVKEDEAARFRDRLTRSDWAKRLESLELFKIIADTLPSFAAQLRALAMRAQERVGAAQDALPSQRWRDENVWFRQAMRLRHIFLSADCPSVIRPEEVAVLLAVPFVYETVLAAAETQVAAAGALLDPKPVQGSEFLLGAWRAHDAVAEQSRRSLRVRNQDVAFDDQVCWSLMAFCHSSGELWDPVGGGNGRSGWALDAVTALLSQAPLPEVSHDRRVCDILSIPRLLRLARLMFAALEDVTLDVSSGTRPLEVRASSGEGPLQLTVNEVRVAHLLNLTGRLTLDSRRLPALLAEHVGVDSALSAEWIRARMAEAEWHERNIGGLEGGQSDRCFDLKLNCDNDAIDAAMLTMLDELESYRTRLLQRQDAHANVMRDLLPAGFTANELNAGPSGWHPTRPSLRFELDRTRIIGLLMGQQLYGERWPALRELYQNALDACRYRRASEQLALHDKRIAGGHVYTGRIVIRFGSWEGRRFVECIDNGIGMADRHLRRLFAYAGQRFTDSHEFHIERARWDRAGITIYPNSRFGVGVLSYFMLAEELEILSRRWVPPAELGPAPVRARIIGSGSLFRLDSAVDHSRLEDDFGTSIRLYLRDDAPAHSSLIKSIQNWLCVPEVSVSIQGDDGSVLDLIAGDPTDSFRQLKGGVLLPVAGSESMLGIPRLYIAPLHVHEYTHPVWRQDQADDGVPAGVLVDGIGTGLAGRPWADFAIVNLSEDLRGMITVDRRRVEPLESAETVNRWLRIGGGQAISSWDNPSFIYLHHTLRVLHPDVTMEVDTSLRVSVDNRVSTVLPLIDIVWPLSRVGVSDLDPIIACELMFAAGYNIDEPYDISNHYGAYDFRPQLARLRVLSIRDAMATSLDPLIVGGMVSRAKVLAGAGLQFPRWLQHVISFDSGSVWSNLPVACGDLLRAINDKGQVGLIEFLRWVNTGHSYILGWLEGVSGSSSSLVSFDITKLDQLGLLHKKLAMISSGYELTWLEIIFFAQSEKIPLSQAMETASVLSGFGLKIPDRTSVPAITHFEDGDLTQLVRFFGARQTENYRFQTRFEGVFFPTNNFDTSSYYVWVRLRNLFSQKNDDADVPPISSDRWQKILLSHDLTGTAPFQKEITLVHIHRAIQSPAFGALSKVVEVGRSLSGDIDNLQYFSCFDDDLIRRFEAVEVNRQSSTMVRRLLHAADCGRPLAAWDLAMAATTADCEPEVFRPVIDLAQRIGANVESCYNFLEFCSGQREGV